MVAAIKIETVTSVTPIEASLTVDKKAFKSILGPLNRVADRKSTMPVLAHLLVTIGKDTTTITATDLNLSATYQAGPALGRKPGAFTVRAKSLADMVSKLPNGEVTLCKTPRGVELLAGAAVLGLESFNAYDYPAIRDS